MWVNVMSFTDCRNWFCRGNWERWTKNQDKENRSTWGCQRWQHDKGIVLAVIAFLRKTFQDNLASFPNRWPRSIDEYDYFMWWFTIDIYIGYHWNITNEILFFDDTWTVGLFVTNSNSIVTFTDSHSKLMIKGIFPTRWIVFRFTVPI